MTKLEQRGFTLVELLLAVGLGVMLSMLILQIYSSNRVAYRVQDGLANLQQNGRFAAYFLSKDIRMAGYQGCSNGANTTATILVDPPNPNAELTIEDAIKGYNGSGGSWLPALPAGLTGLANDTDALTVRFLDPRNSSYLSSVMPDNTADIQIFNTFEIENGDIVAVHDCQNVDIITASPGSSNTTVTHTTSGNTASQVSKAYSSFAAVSRLNSYHYYVKDTGRTNLSNLPIMALFRMDIDGNEQELVEGVEDMQITYGVDTNQDDVVDSFASADLVESNNDWSNVKTVRIALLLNTIEEVNPTEQAYTFDGNTVTNPGDRMLRRQWDVYVSLRSRVL